MTSNKKTWYRFLIQSREHRLMVRTEGRTEEYIWNQDRIKEQENAKNIENICYPPHSFRPHDLTHNATINRASFVWVVLIPQ
jgi:hypothetical protein